MSTLNEIFPQSETIAKIEAHNYKVKLTGLYETKRSISVYDLDPAVDGLATEFEFLDFNDDEDDSYLDNKNNSFLDKTRHFYIHDEYTGNEYNTLEEFIENELIAGRADLKRLIALKEGN